MNATTEKTFGGKTAEEWREQARQSEQRRIDSFERSDTDGFMTQWAADQMATRYFRLAKIAEAGGTVVATAYVDIETGELIRGEWREAQYGMAYAPFDRNRKWIFPSHAKNDTTRERNNAAKGVREVQVRVPVLLDSRSMEVYNDRDAEWEVLDA